MGTKRCKRGKRSSKDKINALPDDILFSIISLLPFKEAVRTSKLSSRWRYLWKPYLMLSSCMNFHVSNCDPKIVRKTKIPSLSERQNFLRGWEERSQKFVSWVERTMKENYSNNDRVMDSFNLCFCLNKEFFGYIDQWINIAIAKGVQDFKLDFSTPNHMTNWDLYTFPSSLFADEKGSYVKCLFLSTIYIEKLGFACFPNLIDLHLQELSIDPKSITKLLTTCKKLEKFSLVKIWYLRENILEISSLNLKHFKLEDCVILDEIKINAINLVKFEYVGRAVKFSFLNFPRGPTDVTIDFIREKGPVALNYALGELSKDIPNMKSLVLTVSRQKDNTIRRNFIPLFTNLETLVLKVISLKEVLWGLVPLLFASTYLCRLELHLSESTSQSIPTPWYFSGKSHDHLKEITVTGFCGTCHEIEFLGYLRGACKALKKMTID